MALNIVIDIVAPYLSSTLVPPTPPHPTAVDFVAQFHIFEKGLRHSVDAIKIPGWHLHILEVVVSGSAPMRKSHHRTLR
jgi:hypothetical protein